jgi:long-chain acyl-CoA synthetase
VAASLLDRLGAHARHVPDRVAVHYFGARITYGALEADTDALARALQGLGVGPGDRVAVFLQNEPGAVLAHYAIWKAGGIVVPLNIMFKERELAYHLADSGASGIVCQSLDASWVAALAGRTRVAFVITSSAGDWIDPGRPRPEVLGPPGATGPPGTLDLRTLIREHRGRRPTGPRPTLGDGAYLHYTSGTTGPPKGALITHANVLFNAGTYQHLCQLGEHDVVLAMAPLFHITGTIGHIAAAGHVGMPLVLLHRFQPAEALRQIHALRPTFTVGSITAFLALLEHPAFAPEKLASLRKLFSGGAPVSPVIVERWERATGTYIHNVWGMTETTSPGTWTPFGERAPVDRHTGTLSVGRPVPGTQVRIVDPDSGQELPPGRVGELTVRGPNVFQGYWRQPEETAHALRDGWLYTGDLATRDAAGWVYWVDRKKDLINVSGFKVWPREVEDVLLQHPAVVEVAVVSAPDAYRGEMVKAVVVLRPAQRGRISAAELTAFCRERIAAYKCPRLVEFRDELPKSPQGKVLKYTLRES